MTAGRLRAAGAGRFLLLAGAVFLATTASAGEGADGVGPEGAVEGWVNSDVGRVSAAPAVADVDGDGAPELVFPNDSDELFVLEADGSIATGWPVRIEELVPRAPTLMDADDDGVPEIFVTTRQGQVFGLRHDGTPVPGWPVAVEGVLGQLTAGDLDCDGRPELAVSTELRFHVWRGSGEPAPGWPRERPQPGFFPVYSLAVGDLDGDGLSELITGLDVLEHDGSRRLGFPLTSTNYSRTGTPLADLDGDGHLELLVLTWRETYLFDDRGVRFPGWPVSIGGHTSEPVPVDLDGDGRLELVVQDYSLAWAFSLDGSLLPGWPVSSSNLFPFGVALGDIDGDGLPDLIVDDRYRFEAWNYRGERVVNLVPQSGVQGGRVTLTDLDADGGLDVVRPAGVRGIEVWSPPVPYRPLTMAWPQAGHDVQRTVRYEPPLTTIPAWVKRPAEVRLTPMVFPRDTSPQDLTAHVSFPEPVDASELEFHLVGEIACRRVGPLLGTRLPAGSGAHEAVVRFDGGALGAILRELPPPPTGHLDLELLATAEDGRVYSGVASVRTSRTPHPEPAIAVSPEELTVFVEAGVPGTAPLQVENVGEAPLTVRDVRITGEGFSLATALPLSVDPGRPEELEVGFAAEVPGWTRGTLTLISDDPASPEIDVLLEGEARDGLPSLEVSPATFRFEAVVVGTEEWQDLVVRNAGTDTLEIVSIMAENPAVSVLRPQLTLPPGAVQTIGVRFAPEEVERGFSLLHLATDDPRQPEVVVGVVTHSERPLLVASTSYGPLVTISRAGGLGLLDTIPVDAMDVEVDPSGTVWVMDYWGSSLWKVAEGQAPAIAATSADGLSGPSTLALDRSGRLLVANSGTGQILAMEGDGTLVPWAPLPPGFLFPGGMTLLSTGEVAVCGYYRPAVAAVSEGGAFREIGLSPTFLGSARDCVADSADLVYVSRTTNPYGILPWVVSVDPDGGIETVYGNDDLVSSWGVEVDGRDRLYVVDPSAGTIVRGGDVFADLRGLAVPLGLARFR